MTLPTTFTTIITDKSFENMDIMTVSIDLNFFAPHLGKISIARNPEGLSPGTVDPSKLLMMKSDARTWEVETFFKEKEIPFHVTSGGLFKNKIVEVETRNFSKIRKLFLELQETSVIPPLSPQTTEKLHKAEQSINFFEFHEKQFIDDFSTYPEPALKDSYESFIQPSVSSLINQSPEKGKALHDIKGACVTLCGSGGMEGSISYFKRNYRNESENYYKNMAKISAFFGSVSIQETLKLTGGGIPTKAAQRKLLFELIKKAFFEKYKIDDLQEKFLILLEMNSIAMGHNYSSVSKEDNNLISLWDSHLDGKFVDPTVNKQKEIDFKSIVEQTCKELDITIESAFPWLSEKQREVMLSR